MGVQMILTLCIICCRLPRVDYLPGDGGAEVESLIYGVNPPLSYVPMYGSAQNPAGRSRPRLRDLLEGTSVFMLEDPPPSS